MSQESSGYDASQIEVLEGLEAVRRRPGMYIGTTGPRGLHRLVFEVVDRALDEFPAGRADRVEVTLLADGGVRVADSGPGVSSGTGLVDELSKLSPSLGLSVVNALSSRFVAEVRREGRREVQEYARGVLVAPPGDAGPAEGGEAGTTFTFWPDSEIFETTQCSFKALAERFRELAFLNRGFDISLTDERPSAEPHSVRYCFADGLSEMVAFLEDQEPDIISFEQDVPAMSGSVAIALRWRASGPERLRSFANSRPTHGGGTHVLGFRDGVLEAVNAYARWRGLLAPSDPDVGPDRIGQGLTAVVSVRLRRPEYEGCIRDVLGNAEVRDGVREAVLDHLGGWLEDHPQQAAAVLERIAPTVYQP